MSHKTIDSQVNADQAIQEPFEGEIWVGKRIALLKPFPGDEYKPLLETGAIGTITKLDDSPAYPFAVSFPEFPTILFCLDAGWFRVVD